MAGLDYVSCDICGKRLFYDGNYSARDYMDRTKSTKGVVCDHCVAKLQKKIAKLKKFDRRKH